MFGYRGANRLLNPEMIKEKAFQHAAILHLSGYAFLEPPQRDAAWKAIAYAKRNDVPISMDTGLEPVMQEQRQFLELLPSLEICISGMEELAVLLGADTAEDAAERLLARGVKLAVIKLGGSGSYFASESMQFHCPAFQVDVKDTTGAGDSFSAGVLYGWGMQLGLAETALLASALGALATMVMGAGLALPDLKKLNDFLKSDRQFNEILLQEDLHLLRTHFSEK